MSAPFEPLGAHRAQDLGLIDEVGAPDAAGFATETRRYAEALARDPRTPDRILAKQCARAWDEARKPLSVYRAEELARSHDSFFGSNRAYHEARHRFVHKTGGRTSAPSSLARVPNVG